MDASALAFDRALGDGQPQTTAAALALARAVSAEVGLEDARAIARRDARPAIGHAQARLAIDAVQAQPDRAARRGVIDCIAHDILDRTTMQTGTTVNRVVDGADILEMRNVARGVPIARPVQGYAIRLALGTHPHSPHATPLIRKYVRYGASPRAAQALVLGAKIHALTRGNAFVSADDIRAVALPVLRHRLLMNFEGEADEINTDTLVSELLKDLQP